MIKRITQIIEKTALGRKLLEDNLFRTLLFTAVNMGINLLYGIINGILGIAYASSWYYTMFAYYILLGLIKLYVVTAHQRADERTFCRKAPRVAGVGILLVAVILTMVVMLTISGAVGRKRNIVVMITIATFTFIIVISTAINTVKAHRKKDMLTIILRDIACSSAVGSVLSLERSMLTTFGEGADSTRFVIEGITGLAGFIFIAFLALQLFVYSSKYKKAD